MTPKQKKDRQTQIDCFVAVNGMQVLDYRGPHPEHLKWERKQAAKRSCNSQRDRASRGKAAYSPFFRRGGGCV